MAAWLLLGNGRVVERFGAASELPLREPVARALVNKGVTLAALGRSDAAIAVCNEIDKRFGAASEPQPENMRKNIKLLRAPSWLPPRALIAKVGSLRDFLRRSRDLQICN